MTTTTSAPMFSKTKKQLQMLCMHEEFEWASIDLAMRIPGEGFSVGFADGFAGEHQIQLEEDSSWRKTLPFGALDDSSW